MKSNLLFVLTLLFLSFSAIATAQTAPKGNTNNKTEADGDAESESAPESIEQNPYEKTSDKSADDSQSPQWVKSQQNTTNAGPDWAEPNPEEEKDVDYDESTVYLPPPPPPPDETAADETSPAFSAEENVCDSVTCSDRGKCVIKGGEPTCACFAGFVPDNVNGLSCIPEYAPPKKPAFDSEGYYAALKKQLGKYDISKTLSMYKAEIEFGTWDGSFSDYLKNSFKRTQNFGVLSMAFGITGFAGGLAMHMLYAGDTNKKGFLAGAVLLDIAGLGLIGTGSAFLTISSQKTKIVEKVDKKYHSSQNTAGINSLSAHFYATSNSAGLSAGMTF